jgi:hypothetical protein
MATQKAFISGTYQGLLTKKATFTDGVLTSVAPARNWCWDDLASYSPGTLTTFTGAEGFNTQPFFYALNGTVGTYTEPRSGLTLNYVDMNPAGSELIIPYPTAWAEWMDVTTTLLISLPDSGSNLSVECWSGWCQHLSGGYSNAATQIIFCTKWYNGSGVGFGAFENLARNVDPHDGHVYYQTATLARRRANGSADTTGLNSGNLYISAHGGASPMLKRTFMHWHHTNNPIWWYGYMNTPWQGVLGAGWPDLTDCSINKTMRMCRQPSRSSSPTWLTGTYCGAGNQNFQTLPYLVNGPLNSFFLYYKEATATYPLRIYFMSNDLINLFPGQ